MAALRACKTTLLVALGTLTLLATAEVACGAGVRAANPSRASVAEVSADGRPAILDNRPIVGILTLPNYFPQWPQYRSYFPASYVKWLEGGGARVVPIPFTTSEEDVRALFPSLNGVLFTGGGAWFLNHTNHTIHDGQLTPYAATGKLLFDLVMEANLKQGRYVPLWATCLGFELLLFLASGLNMTVLDDGFNSLNLPLALDLTPEARSSYMFSSVPASAIETLTTTNSSYNDHSRGCMPAVFASSAQLSSTLTVLSTNTDRNGRPFVSTVEGVGNLPIYGSQWHPEKPQYEWDASLPIPHDPAAIAANQAFASFFGSEVRRNNATFPTAAAASAALIYNYPAVYTEADVPDFEQCYFFD